jgi:hypothetical protein
MHVAGTSMLHAAQHVAFQSTSLCIFVGAGDAGSVPFSYVCLFGSGGSVRRQHVSSASLHGEAANASPSNGAGDDALMHRYTHVFLCAAAALLFAGYAG